MNVHGRLFQARMWREYSQRWNFDRAWSEQILRVSRAKCLQRARVNVYLARRALRNNQESVK